MSANNDYQGAAGLNFFDEDLLLKRILRARLPASGREAALKSLSATGALVGGKLARLIEAAHQDGRYPTLRKFDRWGARVDEVVYGPEQREARKLALLQNCLPPTPLLERMTKAYLLNQNGEGGVTCPLAMTDGLASLLENEASPEQKKRWLPLLHDPESPTPFTAGQFVTERQGGSNVSENETVAEPAGDGSWRLTGLKWFCSNPGELWVTTAKPKGSEVVGLFLVPRYRLDGSLNECHIQRLKDLSGTRGKATAEVEYRGAYAELIGRPSHGMALLLRVVIRASRIHVAAGSLGFLRRALVEARLYAQSRLVLGKPLAENPYARQMLERLEALWTAGMLAYFEELALLDAENPAAEVLVPLLKIQISRLASDAVRQARILMAGNATLRDFSILPRLAEDAIVQEIWEGTHAILAGHVLRALRRPKSRRAFEALAAVPAGKGTEGEIAAYCLRQLQDLLGSLSPGDAEERASEGLKACVLAWRALNVSLLLREAGGALDPEKRFKGLAQIMAREPDGL